MNSVPFTFRLDAPDFIPSEHDNHITRSLSAMKGQLLDHAAYDRMRAKEDSLIDNARWIQTAAS
jgi:hypothetical protein